MSYRIWFVVEWFNTVEFVPCDFSPIGFVADFKAGVRRQGGRVLAVVRPKQNRGHSASVIRHM